MCGWPVASSLVKSEMYGDKCYIGWMGCQSAMDNRNNDTTTRGRNTTRIPVTSSSYTSSTSTTDIHARFISACLETARRARRELVSSNRGINITSSNSSNSSNSSKKRGLDDDDDNSGIDEKRVKLETVVVKFLITILILRINVIY